MFLFCFSLSDVARLAVRTNALCSNRPRYTDPDRRTQMHCPRTPLLERAALVKHLSCISLDLRSFLLVSNNSLPTSSPLPMYRWCPLFILTFTCPYNIYLYCLVYCIICMCRRGRGGHVRIGKVQHTLAKAVHALGCLYLVIILSNYSRFIMLVKKLQFPP